MGYITYTAVDRGELAAGHSEGTEYTIEIGFTRHKPKSKRIIDTTRSLAGDIHTEYHNKETYLTVKTALVKDPVIRNEIEEFFSSVDGGEEFLIDPFGVVASPSTLYTATLIGDPDHAPHENMTWKTYSFEFDYKPEETVKS